MLLAILNSISGFEKEAMSYPKAITISRDQFDSLLHELGEKSVLAEIPNDPYTDGIKICGVKIKWEEWEE